MAEYVRLDRLLWPDPVPAGMNLLVIASLAYTYRGSNEDVNPIHVTRVGKKLFRISDGRHRATAAMLAGRKRILAEVTG